MEASKTSVLYIYRDNNNNNNNNIIIIIIIIIIILAYGQLTLNL